jgi:NAD(P)-dependent dehydrogenase (short-subunit alcohol dehydrogenase family)
MTYKIPQEYLEPIKKTIGLERFGSIDELINTIDFIINNEYITGFNLKIDGGL